MRIKQKERIMRKEEKLEGKRKRVEGKIKKADMGKRLATDQQQPTVNLSDV